MQWVCSHQQYVCPSVLCTQSLPLSRALALCLCLAHVMYYIPERAPSPSVQVVPNYHIVQYIALVATMAPTLPPWTTAATLHTLLTHALPRMSTLMLHIQDVYAAVGAAAQAIHAQVAIASSAAASHGEPSGVQLPHTSPTAQGAQHQSSKGHTATQQEQLVHALALLYDLLTMIALYKDQQQPKETTSENTSSRTSGNVHTAALHRAAVALLMQPGVVARMHGGQAAAVLCGWAVHGVGHTEGVGTLVAPLLERVRADDGGLSVEQQEALCRLLEREKLIDHYGTGLKTD